MKRMLGVVLLTTALATTELPSAASRCPCTCMLTADGRDDAGHDAPNGVLFLAITANGSTQTGKLVRMR